MGKAFSGVPGLGEHDVQGHAECFGAVDMTVRDWVGDDGFCLQFDGGYRIEKRI